MRGLCVEGTSGRAGWAGALAGLVDAGGQLKSMTERYSCGDRIGAANIIIKKRSVANRRHASCSANSHRNRRLAVVYAIDPKKKTPQTPLELVTEANALRLVSGADINIRAKPNALMHLCCVVAKLATDNLPAEQKKLMGRKTIQDLRSRIIKATAGSFVDQFTEHETSRIMEEVDSGRLRLTLDNQFHNLTDRSPATENSTENISAGVDFTEVQHTLIFTRD